MRRKLENIFSEFAESFESFVDLFTILSFTLIVAAYFFGVYRNLKDEGDKSSSFELYEVVSEGNADVLIPEDAVIIFLTKSGQADVVQFSKSGKDASQFISIDEQTLVNALEGELADYKNSKNISLVTLSRNGPINLNLFYLIQIWLVKNGYEKVKLVFD
jgi:hypothetical protein